MRRIAVEPVISLDEHAEYAYLVSSVEALRAEAAPVARALRGRTLWMINSASQGGGVAEMMPGMITHLRELGISTEWLVIDSAEDLFFQLTKRLHNMIHGDGVPGLDDADRRLFERVNRENADALRGEVRRGDIVVVHDPQPMPLAGMLRETTEVTTIWRCHIGLDSDNAVTNDAWRFLEPYAADYDHAIFSAPEYVARSFEGRSSVIYPAIDPLTDKNRPLSVQAVVAVLQRSSLLREPGPRVQPQPHAQAHRLQPDGSWQVAVRPDDLGLLTRPVVTQVSRWDRLKGFLPLMRGFATLKERAANAPHRHEGARRTHELCRLVLAGPEPDSIGDDPEAREVLEELRQAYIGCAAPIRADIALISLPMQDPVANAITVNALQRVSTIAVQNSLREGFGLTIAEAMWKRIPVLTNTKACGPRQQVRDGVDGVMIADPEGSDAIADALQTMLAAGPHLDLWGRSGQRRVYEKFLIYTHLQHWVRLLGTLTGAVKAA